MQNIWNFIVKNASLQEAGNSWDRQIQCKIWWPRTWIATSILSWLGFSKISRPVINISVLNSNLFCKRPILINGNYIAEIAVFYKKCNKSCIFFTWCLLMAVPYSFSRSSFTFSSLKIFCFDALTFVFPFFSFEFSSFTFRTHRRKLHLLS